MEGEHHQNYSLLHSSVNIFTNSSFLNSLLVLKRENQIKINSLIKDPFRDKNVMRKLATVKNNHPTIKQVMIYECEGGVYVFPFDSLEDGASIGDEWYQSLSEADSMCENEYGISANDWKYIDDPLDGCQHDWIMPVQVRARNVFGILVIRRSMTQNANFNGEQFICWSAR